MIYAKPDGAIELGLSGCCCPPGERHSGMHTNATTSWWRTPGDQWTRITWPRMHDVRILAAASETAAEFYAEMKKAPKMPEKCAGVSSAVLTLSTDHLGCSTHAAHCSGLAVTFAAE